MLAGNSEGSEDPLKKIVINTEFMVFKKNFCVV